MLELIQDECKQDPDLVFKIKIFRSQIRPKMNRICNPDHYYHGSGAKSFIGEWHRYDLTIRESG